MSTKIFLLSAVFLIFLFAIPVLAEDINVVVNPDNPEILVTYCGNDSIKFAPADSIEWPDDSAHVGVWIHNERILNGLHLHASWTTGAHLTYRNVIFNDAVWPDHRSYSMCVVKQI